MKRHRRSTSFLLLPAAAVLALCCSNACAYGLAAESNVLIKSPYSDATAEHFGRGVTSGDFDGDGIDDLAIAETGSERLRILRGQDWNVGGSGLVIKFAANTVTAPRHSYIIASGDFDGDGRDEIAVNTTSGGPIGSGGVYVLDRSAGGGWSVQTEIRAGGSYPGAQQMNANLGNALAVGDFDDDGYADLAIGMRGQIVNSQEDAGAVMITYGSASGIGPSGARIINRNNDGLTFDPRESDHFGAALAAGDFDADGDDDLAVGIPGATCPDGSWRGGGVVTLNGSPSGITNAQSRIWRAGVLGVAGSCNNAANFGQSLATGVFDFNDFADLAVGAPVNGSVPAAVFVLYGTASGLDAEASQRITPPSVAGIDNTGGLFGNSLATGNFAYRCVSVFCRRDSLAIGAPFSAVNGVSRAGVVWQLNSQLTGALDPATIRPILPVAPLEIGAPHDNDQFGNALASGDFNGDSLADLAIGVYLYDDGASTNEGAVQVLYQSEYLFADGFD